MTPRRIGVWVAGLLPAVGLLLLVVKAEISQHQGPTFRIPIRGYDPRDLLHGQYLRYQFEFDWAGEDTCGGSPRRGVTALKFDCCLCVTRTLSNGVNPSVRQVACGDAALSCDGWIRVKDVTPPLRYFVPENSARELQRALSDGDAHPSVELTLPHGGKPAVKELYLGDKPWREVLGRSSK